MTKAKLEKIEEELSKVKEELAHFKWLNDRKEERMSSMVKQIFDLQSSRSNLMNKIIEQDKLIDNFKKYQKHHWMKFQSLFENKRGSE